MLHCHCFVLLRRTELYATMAEFKPTDRLSFYLCMKWGGGLFCSTQQNTGYLCKQRARLELLFSAQQTSKVKLRMGDLRGLTSQLISSFGRDIKLGVPCLDVACTVGLNQLSFARNSDKPTQNKLKNKKQNNFRVGKYKKQVEISWSYALKFLDCRQKRCRSNFVLALEILQFQ